MATHLSTVATHLPPARLFGTTNDEQKAAMRGSDGRLGYVPDPPTTTYEKRSECR